LVRRARVIEALSRSTGIRAVCMQAPGGFGKSTLMAQWLADDPRPTLWLAVRPEAPDAGWIARALMDALAEAHLLERRVALPLSVDPITWTAGVLPAVEAALSAIVSPVVVVVDDAGEIDGAAWESLLGTIVRCLPPGSQLVLATRGAVPKPLRRLRSDQALLTLGPDQLALDAIEGAEVLRNHAIEVPDATLLALLEETEGWPVAFYLAALALRSRPRVAVRRESLALDQALADYLRDEILDRLPPADAQFLLRASVLTYLDESTCDAVTGTETSLARLRRLAGANHLLVPVDALSNRFRMHALLAEFLSDELRMTDPGAWRAAHAAASALREEAGDLDAAAHHAKLAGDDIALGALLWRQAGRVLASSQAAVLRRWLDGVPDERVSRVCELALCAGWLASHEGDMARMEHMAVTAEALCARQGGARSRDVGLLKATIGAEGLGQIESAAVAFIAASDSDEVWLTLAHFLHGVSLVLRGEVEQGLAALDRGHRLARALGLPVMQSHCLAAQADAWLAVGEPARAMPLIRGARTVIAEHRLDLIATTAPVFTTSAVGYLAEGRPGDAQKEAMRALRQSSMIRSIAPWYAVQGRVTLAEVFLALGDLDRAKALLDEADAFRGPATRSVVLDEAYERARQRVTRSGALSAGVEVLTAAEVRVVQYLPTHLSFPQIAQELTLSPHTVKSQAMSAYRKLGAHTRGEAIRRAREIGLLPTS
jgi:LuxR family maltose regulon positive regulatory protein